MCNKGGVLCGIEEREVGNCLLVELPDKDDYFAFYLGKVKFISQEIHD